MLLPTWALSQDSRLNGPLGASAQPSYSLMTSMPWYGVSGGRPNSFLVPPKAFSGLPIDTHDTSSGLGVSSAVGSATQSRIAW